MSDVPHAIHAKIVELAKQLGKDARKLGMDGGIPASGLLDSSSLIELIVWCEMEFGVEIDQDDLTLDNFGTINAIAAYLAAGK